MILQLRLSVSLEQKLRSGQRLLLRLNRQEMQVFQAEIGKLEKMEREGVMEIVTSWMEQGLQQGLQQGSRSLVLRLLTRKVGNIPDGLQSQIDQLEIAQLEALGEALLDFASLTDLEAWLAAQG